MPLTDKLRNVKIPRQRTTPVWQGPGGEGPQGGITQGLLGRYLCCAERFRLLTMEGLKPADTFNARMEFGNLWHVAEEALANGQGKSALLAWINPLHDYAQALCRRYPLQQQEIDHWYTLCKAQFPLYVAHWAEHPDVKERAPLLQEQVFDVPYTLSSGRIVRLRGKWDSVDLIGTGKGAGIYIQENKTKSQINRRQLAQQLTFDLQTMVYLIALTEWQQLNDYGKPIRTPQAVENKVLGVRYNVVRRSAHKSVDSMLKKIEDDRKAGRLTEWFDRWKVEVNAADLIRFRRECLDPVLENLCDDYEWWSCCKASPGGNIWDGEARFGHHRPRHFRMPYGIWNPLHEGGSSELDEYLATGSTAGLQRAEDLFPELKEDKA